MSQALNVISALLIVPAALLKLVLMVVMVLPEIVLHRFRGPPEVWWLYDVKNRNILARTFPKWYWYAIRNTLPWLRLPLFEVQYSVQHPRHINIESVYLRDSGQPKGWRFTRYKWLLAEWEYVRAYADSYDEFRLGWAVEGRKLKITTQRRTRRAYGT